MLNLQINIEYLDNVSVYFGSFKSLNNLYIYAAFDLYTKSLLSLATNYKYTKNI